MGMVRKLLVEGAGDRRVVTELAKKHGIDLGKKVSGQYPVQIEEKSMPALLDPEFLATVAAGSGLRILGLIVDADEDSAARLEELRESCWKGLRRELPEEFPAEGLILSCEEGQPKLGVWLMPDNSNRGMLESFLAYLIPAAGNDCWEWTAELCREAKAKGATFKDLHLAKARIHAYLAFQDEPGRQLHEALINRVLDPEHEMAKKFLAWLCRLFELNPAAENRREPVGA